MGDANPQVDQPIVLDALTPRRTDCLWGVWSGLQAAEIAAELKLSPRTVEKHLAEARQALGTSSSLAAARLAAGALGWPEGRNQYSPQGLRLPNDEPAGIGWCPSDAEAAADQDSGPTRGEPQAIVVMLKWAAKIALYSGALITGLLLLLNALQISVGHPIHTP